MALRDCSRLAGAALASLCTVLGVACAEPSTRPGPGLSFGNITPQGAANPVIVVPADIRVGMSIPITVNTFGSSSCVRPAGMDIQYRSGAVTLTPWDEPQTQYEVCTADVAPRPHDARPTFVKNGAVILKVRGFVINAQGRRALCFVTDTIDVRN
jgi:hypothetical protein